VAGLLAQSFDPSVHLQSDAFMPFVVNGWVDPWRAESAHQNEVMGAAFGSAAIQFAVGGYTVILDGSVFPEGIEALAGFCAARNVRLHYAVLRPDLGTCLSRMQQRLEEQRRPRQAGRPEYDGFFDRDALTRQHDRFLELGCYEASVLDAEGSPEQVAQAVLAGVEAGSLLVREPTARE